MCVDGVRGVSPLAAISARAGVAARYLHAQESAPGALAREGAPSSLVAVEG